MRIVVAHPTGNQFVRALLSTLQQREMLSRFYTTMAVSPDSWWLKLFPAGLRAELTRRSFPVSGHLLDTRPGLELARCILPKLGYKRAVRHETGFASLDQVYMDLDRFVASRLKQEKHENGAAAVYAYEDGALETFREAKRLGMLCIYDLPIAYWEVGKQLMREEAARLPEWAVTLGGGVADSADKLKRKTAELELADIVVVPSGFVRDSLPAWAFSKQIIVSPFGSPQDRMQPAGNDMLKADNRLKVLFAGSMGQRKGLGDLFQAMKMLDGNKIELVVMGSLQAPMEFYRNKYDGFVYAPERPHGQVLELMAGCDVFCLPSILEGRALVMQEAMSQGLPLIITPNTGGSDLVIAGETGFLVPVRSPEQIAMKLQWCIDNRERVKEMGEMARLHAANYIWKTYSDRIVNQLNTVYAGG